MIVVVPRDTDIGSDNQERKGRAEVPMLDLEAKNLVMMIGVMIVLILRLVVLILLTQVRSVSLQSSRIKESVTCKASCSQTGPGNTSAPT